MKIRNISESLLEGSNLVKFEIAPEVLFKKIKDNYKYKFIFESKSTSESNKQAGLIGVDPVLKVVGKDSGFTISVLNKRGDYYFQKIKNADLADICDEYCMGIDNINGLINKTEEVNIAETEKTKKRNISQIIRLLLTRFKTSERTILGLYGAFSYDFVRQFEDLNKASENDDPNDFTLFLFDTFFSFDQTKDELQIIAYRETKEELETTVNKLISETESPNTTSAGDAFAISNAKFLLDKNAFEKMVEVAREHTKQGDIFQVVLSNKLKAEFRGDTYALYLKYRQISPAPYLFYFDFCDEQLVGASPEMMIRVEDRIVNLRPIAGTAPRGSDPIADHDNLVNLLKSPKERSELDMLIDLGRNDLSRVCKHGIELRAYRCVEKHSKVMHTYAHLAGELKQEYDTLDAFISTLNAGTLTGAPKVQAMKIIDNLEEDRRGYYGGTMGNMTFSGDMDSAIIIRTAHIRSGKLTFQVGAGILNKSNPSLEYAEILNKAAAFLDLTNNELTHE